MRSFCIRIGCKAHAVREWGGFCSLACYQDRTAPIAFEILPRRSDLGLGAIDPQEWLNLLLGILLCAIGALLGFALGRVHS